MPGIIHLLKTMSENQQREHDDDDGEQQQHVVPVRPLDHLAKFLFRHNPRHANPVCDRVTAWTAFIHPVLVEN